MTMRGDTLHGAADGKDVEVPKSPPWAGGKTGELATKILMPTTTSSKVHRPHVGKTMDPAASKAMEKLRNLPKSCMLLR